MERQTKNQRQLAHSVMNTLRNLLNDDEMNLRGYGFYIEAIKEMSQDMERLNDLRKIDGKW